MTILRYLLEWLWYLTKEKQKRGKKARRIAWRRGRQYNVPREKLPTDEVGKMQNPEEKLSEIQVE